MKITETTRKATAVVGLLAILLASGFAIQQTYDWNKFKVPNPGAYKLVDERVCLVGEFRYVKISAGEFALEYGKCSEYLNLCHITNYINYANGWRIVQTIAGHSCDEIKFQLDKSLFDWNEFNLKKGNSVTSQEPLP